MNLFSLHKELWFGMSLCIGLFLFLLLCYQIRKHKYYHDISRKKKPNHIWIQVAMVGCLLLAFLWLCFYCVIYNVSSDKVKWLAGVGVLLTWMCQDTIKNGVAFVTLVFNRVLHIGDWIIVEKYGIDGKVEDISLTSVIVKNWDNSLSTISTYSLLNTQMQNLQQVVDKKTPGRRMMRNFLIDIQSVHSLSKREFTAIKKALAAEDITAIEYAEKQDNVQNLHVFRFYLQHWLLSQKTVSRSPKFAVRLLDTTAEGLPLQVYTFLLPSRWEEFEQEQARIVEHVIDTMHLFGLVLFQYPAGTDTNKVELKMKKMR